MMPGGMMMPGVMPGAGVFDANMTVPQNNSTNRIPHNGRKGRSLITAARQAQKQQEQDRQRQEMLLKKMLGMMPDARVAVQEAIPQQSEAAPQKSQPELPILPRSSTGGTSPHNESAPQKSRVDLPIFPRSSSKDSAAAENRPEA